MAGDVTGCAAADPALLDRLRESARCSAETGRPDRELLAELAGTGVLGTAVPVRHGGAGGSAAEINHVVEQVATVNPSVAIILFQHFAVCARIVEWGSDEQQARWLPRLADGTCLAASAWSETGAGAAKLALSTRGVREPDGRWRLTGDKSFATGADVAQVYLVLVQTGPPDPEPGGYGSGGQTFFLVGAGRPGVEADLGLNLAGMRGSATGFVRLRGCLVRDADRVGPEGGAQAVIAGVRESGATLGAVSAGVARSALDVAARHLDRLGPRAAGSQRLRLVDLATQVEAARAVVERAGRRSSDRPGLTTLHSKLFASTTAELVCAEVARMLGSAGYVLGHELNRLAADARAVALMGPTNDLCRDLVVSSWTA